MERIKLSYSLAFAIAGLIPLFHLACSRSSDESMPAPKLESAPVASTASAPSLAAVNASLKAGAFDDAAARLLELQASGRSFSQREAGEYRRALNEAYTKALEAAEKGDPRAQAAINMIRATSPR